jgi:hypothetical protein
MSDLQSHIAFQPDANSRAVFYSLLQAQNPGLTVPLSSITFGASQFNTQAQAAANGNTTSNVQISASGFGAPVTVYYNQVNLADQVPDPKALLYAVGEYGIPALLAPSGRTYHTVYDFVTVLNAAGFPVTGGDLAYTSLVDYWTGGQYSSYTYQNLAAQLVSWSNTAMGYTGTLWVLYGPGTPVDLATAFPQSYNNILGGPQQGDAAECLTSYNSAYLSGQQGSGNDPQGFGASLNRSNTTYSNLTVLDSTTSQQYGGAEVSALVTYAANPNVMVPHYNQPFWPYYSGSQTVYYDRIAPTIGSISQLFQGYSATPYVAADGLHIPLGAQLGTTIVTTHDLLQYLQPAMATRLDTTDIVAATLPTAYTSGSVTFDLTFSGSYLVKDGSIPLVLEQTGPDMSPIVHGVTDFPISLLEGNWSYYFNPSKNVFAQAPSVDIALVILNYWIDSYPNNDDISNWGPFLTASVVSGTLLPTDAATAAAHSNCGFQATLQVDAPWGASFQQQVYFDKINLATLPHASAGVLSLVTDTQMFGQPMRVIDWITCGGTQYNSGSGISGYGLTGYINWQEFTNLHELVLMDGNGNLSFTLTAPANSTTQEGSVQVVIALDSSLPDAQTNFQLYQQNQAIPIPV